LEQALHQETWRERQHREEIAARRKQDEQNRDEQMEQCVIAYVSWVRDFGPKSFEEFCRDWFQRPH
jgi:hypothetical protein